MEWEMAGDDGILNSLAREAFEAEFKFHVPCTNKTHSLAPEILYRIATRSLTRT